MKSTLKERHRYIAFKMISDTKYDRKEIESGLRKELLRLVGEIDYSTMLPKLIFYEDGKGIIKVLREGLDKTKAALSLVSAFENKRIHLMPVFISGTIRGCKRGMSKK